jgi:hypothetical protein
VNSTIMDRPVRRLGALIIALTLGSFLSCGAALADALELPPAALDSAADVSPTADPIADPVADPDIGEDMDVAPDLRLSVSFDDRPYAVGEPVPMTVIVTNVGDGLAYGPSVSFSSTELSISPDQWGEFGAPGARIEAGETKTVELVARGDRGHGSITVRIRMSVNRDKFPADNETTVQIALLPPPFASGDIDGVVFGDRNTNQTYDPGEQLSGVTVVLGLSSESPEPRTVTDTEGHFAFADVPSQEYRLTFYDAPDNWIIPHTRDVRVDGTDRSTGLKIRGTLRQSSVLSASIAFTGTGYQPGGQAQLRLTLTNSATSPIVGIKTSCGRSAGPGSEHLQLGSGWEQFAPDTAGVTVAAGRTRTFALAGTVPLTAAQFGRVHISCSFGTDELNSSGFPVAYDHRRVIGTLVTTKGRIYTYSPPGSAAQDVPNIKVDLIDPHTRTRVASSTTGPTGIVVFHQVPGGWYLVRVGGPWRVGLDHEVHTNMPCRGWYPACSVNWAVSVTPAPPPPAPGQPVPQGSDLAHTGADITRSSMAGAAMVTLGLMITLVSRRRRDQHDQVPNRPQLSP